MPFVASRCATIYSYTEVTRYIICQSAVCICRTPVASLCRSLGRSWALDLNHWILEFVPLSSAPFLNRIFDWNGYIFILSEETSTKQIFEQTLSLLTVKFCVLRCQTTEEKTIRHKFFKCN